MNEKSYKNGWVKISHIEQYDYCPLQCYYSINGAPHSSIQLTLGEQLHSKKEQRTKNYIKRNIENTLRKRGKFRPQKGVILAKLEGKNHYLGTEVYCQSEELKIYGYVDEIEIFSDKIVLREFKTTQTYDIKNYYFLSAMLQLKAYAIAFKEYYDTEIPIYLEVWRINKVIENSEEKGCSINDYNIYHRKDNEWLLRALWGFADIGRATEQKFEVDTDTSEVKEVAQKIIKGRFPSTNNTSKCNACQYKKNCPECKLGVLNNER